MSPGYLILKYAITAALIVAASEIAKRSDKMGALILALPLMTILTMFWLSIENQGEAKIANHAWYSFWYTVPTLPMFLFFPMLLRNFGFALSMLVFLVGTAVIFLLFALYMRRFGVELL